MPNAVSSGAVPCELRKALSAAECYNDGTFMCSRSHVGYSLGVFVPVL